MRNRIVNTTHRSGLSDRRDLAYLARRAQGGAGLIGLRGSQGVAEYLLGPGSPGGGGEWDRLPPRPSSADGVAYYDAVVIPPLRERADALRALGARTFAQVAHGGASVSWPQISPAIGPSTVPDSFDARIPHALTDEQIQQLVLVFAHGIRRIHAAGVDAAEIHAAHGYLVMQFLSPHYNRRTDRWGGSVDNRLRFLREIIAAARTMTDGEIPIGLRLGYDGDGSGRGITIDGAVEIARAVADDLAYISVSGGTSTGVADGQDGAYVSPWYRPPAYNADAAAALRAAVDVPILVTGRIADAALADSLIADGTADLIGMVRGLIADPDLPAKAQSGRPSEIRMCLGLSECHHIGRFDVPVTCAVNAASGREDEIAITPADRKKVVAVVGAGPAGMEAARVAALRGHTVYLGDSHRHLGGTVALLGRDPNRRNLRDHAAFFEAVLPRLGVEMLLGHTVTADDILAFEADAVILATGGRPRVPEIDGFDQVRGTLTALDVLEGRMPNTERVIVYGGVDNDVGPPTIAEFLADAGHVVSLVCEQPDFAAGAEDATRFALLQRLKRKAVDIAQTARVTRIDALGATILDTFTRAEWRVDDVTLVIACGQTPADELHTQLAERGVSCELIGDALAPRRIMHATLEGARAALAI
ncbi:MAG: FAD-dependent oxidoreductase [Microbacterium sp.]